jgi:hypothetical protein
MNVLGSVSALALFLTSLVLGGRLLWMGRGRLAAPESLLGLALFLGGAVAFPLSIASNEAALDPGLRVRCGAASYVAMYGMLMAKTGFVWSVFRRGERWAQAVFAFFATAPLVLLAAQLADGGLAAFYLEHRGVLRWTQLVQWLCDVWAMTESFRYYGVMRRRLRIGLADPVVTDRFRLWGLANGGAVLASGSIGIAGGGVDALASPALMTFVAGTSLGSAVALWLAFLPPRAYCERVSRQAEGSGAAAESRA